MASDYPIVDELISIWRTNGCQDGDYVFLSSRRGKNWQDQSFRVSSSLKDEISAWIKSRPPKDYDLYWSPLLFKEPRRRTENVKASNLLWSDMDDVDLSAIEEKHLMPTYLWESSPGRFQGLWLLDKQLPPIEAQNLNRSLSYEIGADKSGWDLTQVLRVPGTINHKYPDTPPVGKIIRNGVKYCVSYLEERLKPSTEELPDNFQLQIPEVSRQEVLNILTRYHGKIPRKVLTLLFSTSATHGKRSDILWYIEHALHDAGVSPSETLVLVKSSVWNKYRGRPDEDHRLLTEMKKILENKFQELGEDEAAVPEREEPRFSMGFNIESYSEVLGKIATQPGWLVEGFWTKRSHGIVAGEPKSLKSILTTDLALSIASGKPFLGQFPVKESGPVLIVQNENADWIMKDRIEKMIINKGLGGEVKSDNPGIVTITFPPQLPIYFINQQGYQFNDPIHRALLEEAIKKIKPILVIFDPLYLMFDGDVNSAKDLNPVLNWLLYLKTEYKTGVIVVHHWNKGSSSKRGGQRMLGSTTLHGWVESAWYIEVISRPEGDGSDEVNPEDTPPITLVLEREFRSAGIFPKVELTVSMGGFNESTYSVEVKRHTKKKKAAASQGRNLGDDQDRIMELFRLNKKPLSLRLISENTGLSKRRANEAIKALVESGEIRETSSGYEVV